MHWKKLVIPLIHPTEQDIFSRIPIIIDYGRLLGTLLYLERFSADKISGNPAESQQVYFLQWMTKTAHDDLCQHYGISHISENCQILSIKLFASFPHEWMHLVLENHVKNLIHLWKGSYKGLDEGKECYVITNGDWVQIGLETAALSAMIPSSFSWCTPNIWTEQHQFTAEDYSHWFLFITPFILKDRFLLCKIYAHFMLLHSILHTMLKYSISKEDVNSLWQTIITYVQQYER